MLVTGGNDGSHDSLSSTELLVGTASAWVFTGELPSPRGGLRGVNIENKVLMTGGNNYKIFRMFYWKLNKHIHADEMISLTNKTVYW